MRFPTVILCDRECRVSAALRCAMPDAPWVLRHVQDFGDCRLLPASADPVVLFLRPAGEVVTALELLDWLQARGAATRTVLLLDAPDVESEALAWNLGVAVVLQRPDWPCLPAILRALIASRS